jgi:hypothetical protein
MFCGTHRLPGMINVLDKRCRTCPTLASNKAYKGYCYRCFIHAFPDNTIVRNHKTKERAVADFIRSEFPQYDISFDRRIEDGCSAYRPDVCIDVGSHSIIIEIDENQHETYDCSCENKRLMQLFLDSGSRPMTMIRFNPDGYINHKGRSVSSCWGYTAERGLCKVKAKKEAEWAHRLDTLKRHLHYTCTQGVHKDIDVIHLFYDGWSFA